MEEKYELRKEYAANYIRKYHFDLYHINGLIHAKWMIKEAPIASGQQVSAI